MVFVQSKFQQKQPNWIELYTILQIFCEAIFSKWRGWKLNRLMASRGQKKWGSNLPSRYFWARAGFISKDKTRARRSSDQRETGPIVTGPGADLSHLCESGQLFRVTLIIADSFCYSRLIAPWSWLGHWPGGQEHCKQLPRINRGNAIS